MTRGICAAALAMLAALLGGCAALPERGPVRVVAPAALPAAVSVADAGGTATPASEAATLAQLRAEGAPALLERQLGVLAANGEADLYRGNSARLLVDGPQAFAAMKDAVRQARHRVLLESYIVEDGGIGDEMAALLVDRAQAGVQVALLYDSIGSFGTDARYFDVLKAGGVAVCAYNPLNPLEAGAGWNPVQRDHRKILVADSDAGYTGGINISPVYGSGSFGGSRASGGGKDEQALLDEGWRDTQIELRGPAVAALATAFREAWAQQKCDGDLSPAPAALADAPGQRVVKIVTSHPEDRENRIYTTLLAATDAALRSIHVTMAYFAPGRDWIDALVGAARRGVDVALVLPGHSDAPLLMHAARSYYEELLDAGVRIHERRGAVLHAKTAVIDGVFSTVGSSNLDWRSFSGNAEVNAFVLGDDFGQQMEALFARDLAASRRIDRDDWSRRGFRQRFMEGLARAMEPLL